MNSKWNRFQWGTLLSCSLSCFIAWLDYAIVNTALSAIEESLSASFVQLEWVMNAFILALTVLIIAFGRFSDRIGRRRMNILGVSLFGFFSLLAGLAESPNWLIFCRAMQGAASALIVPTSLALISQAFSGAEKGKAIGIWSGVMGLGLALGPVAGGFLVSALTWRWIFFINIPFAIASVFLSALLVKEPRPETQAHRIDLKGLFLMTVGLCSLVFGLMYAPDWGWASVPTLLLIALGIIALCWFYYLEKRSASPLIPFSLFSIGPFFGGAMTMAGLNFVFTSSLFLIPLYLIEVRGQPPYQAGLMMFSITACIAILSPYIGRLIGKISIRNLVLIGLIPYLASTVFQFFFTEETSILFVLASFLFMGIGWAIARTPATTTAIASAPHQFAGTATGVLWTVQNSSGALSIAITLTLFRSIFEKASTTDSFLAGYHAAMGLLSVVTIGGILMAFMLFKKETINE